MKKMKLFCGALIGLMALTACSSDDDNSNPDSPSLVGTWKQVNEIDYCSTGGQETISLDSCEQNGRFKFNSNGTYSITSYEFDGGSCQLDSTENGNWEISNGSLLINHQEGSWTFTTFVLTDNTLKIGSEMIIPGEPCNDGHLVSYELNFVRVD